MLEALGISDLEERVYRLLLRAPNSTIAQLARAADISPRRMSSLLHDLEEKGLVSRVPGAPRGVIAAPPRVSLEVLILQREEQLERARLLATELDHDFRRATTDRAPSELVEVVAGREAIGQRWEQLQRSAKEEICGFDKPPYSSAPETNVIEFERLAQGVVYRGLYDQESLEVPGLVALLRKLVQAGEQTRVLPGLPMKLAIADRRLAMIPLSLEGGLQTAVLIHPSPLLDSLALLFEILWERALPLSVTGDDQIELRDAGPGALSPRDQEILLLLAAGLKDEVIARHLNVGVRTVGRDISRLMGALDARTRFQAGMQVIRKNWLSSD